MAHVLVTGGNGYIGSHLVSKLLERDHYVTAVDWMVFGRHPLAAHVTNPKFRLLPADVRGLRPEVINGVDAICDLATIHAPTGALDEAIVLSVNHLARRRLGLLAKALGVKHYLLASSIAASEPVGADRQADRLAEQSLLALADEEFAVTILRFGSVYGLSRRMRFDLPLNAFTHEAYRSRTIAVAGDATTPEAMVHAADAAQMFVQILQQAAAGGRKIDVFQSYTSLPELARIVARTLPFPVSLAGKAFSESSATKRASHRASVKTFLPSPAITIEQAVMEVYIAIASGRTYRSFVTRTADVYITLAREGRLTGAELFNSLPRRRQAS